MATTTSKGASAKEVAIDVLRKTMESRVDRDDRTGTGTRAIFG